MDRKTAVTVFRLWSNHVNLNVNAHILRLQWSYKDESTPAEEKHLCRFCMKAEESVIHFIRFCTDPTASAACHKIPKPLGPTGTPQNATFLYKWNWKNQLAQSLLDLKIWIGLTKFFQAIEVNI
jgi:hypothetical protein